MDPTFKRNSILKRPILEEASPSTTFSRNRRRISFSGKKSIKEFLPGDDKATIWGTSYEESAEGLQIQQTTSESHCYENDVYYNMETSKTNSISKKRESKHAILPVQDKENINTNEAIENNEIDIHFANVDNKVNTDNMEISRHQLMELLQMSGDSKKIRNNSDSLNLTLNTQELLLFGKKSRENLHDYSHLAAYQNSSPLCTSITLFRNEMRNVRDRKYNLDTTLNQIRKNEDGIQLSTMDFTLNNYNCELPIEKRRSIITSTETPDALDNTNNQHNSKATEKQWSSRHFEQEKFNQEIQNSICKDGNTPKLSQNSDNIISVELSLNRNKTKKVNSKSCQTSECTDGIVTIGDEHKNIVSTKSKPSNLQAINFPTAEYNDNNVEISLDRQNTMLDHGNLQSKCSETISFESNEYAYTNMELSLIHDNIMFTEELQKNESKNRKMKNRQTIHFKTNENDLDLSLNTDKMTTTEEVEKLSSKYAIPSNRETINFQTAGQNDANNMELTIKSDNIMPVKKLLKYNLKQTYTKNNPITNFENSEIDDKNNMELSFNTANTMIAHAPEKLLTRNPNAKIRRTINFQTGCTENENELCLNHDPMMSVQELQQNNSDIENLKNRQTIHFKTDENDLEFTLNPDKITSTKEVENFMPVVKQQIYSKNNPITNFETNEINESNMELSFNSANTVLVGTTKKLLSRNCNKKARQTINFQTGCAENEIELCLNHDQIMSAEELEKTNSGMQNLKNRETIHFKTDENDLDLSLNPDKMTSTEEVRKLRSKFAVPRNRETINFQSAGQNDAYNMELTIKSENIMPIEEYQKYNLKQTHTKNNPITNFETSEIDDKSNMELSFNTPQTMITDAQERLLLRNPNTKIQQTINFQIGGAENEKELCLNHDQMMSVVQQSKSDIQNLKNRKTIHFKTDENDLDLSLNPDKMTSTKEVEKLCSKFAIPRNRETINFQSAGQNDAYNMELTIKSENIIPVEEYQKYTLKQTYTENNPITNLLASEIDDESNMELSFNTPQTMITDAQERLLLRNPNTKIDQSINFQIGDVENEKELCLNYNQMMSVVQQSKSDIQNLKNRKTIHFKTDENDLDLSLNSDKITSSKEVEKLCSKFEIPRNRETINFQTAEQNDAYNMELTIKSENIIPIEEYQKYTLKQTYTENNPITNLVTSEIDDESNMELSFNTPQTMITDAQERLFLRNPNTKIHQTINFQIGGAENEKELCLNHDQMMSVVQQSKSDIQNLKNRKTIHFKSDENDLDLSLNSDKITSSKEVEKLCSKFEIPRNRETINFQTAEQNDAYNMELTIKSENIMPVEEYQNYTLQQIYTKNNPIPNFKTSGYADDTNMELSFNTVNTMLEYPEQRLLSRNPNAKIRRTINFQTGCAENENKLCLNHDPMMSVQELQQTNSDIQNLKNRKTIHFKTDENDLELTLNPDKITSTKEVENFMPVVKQQKYTLKQIYSKNNPITNFETNEINVSNMELSFNSANKMLVGTTEKLLSKNRNKKARQTINFQTGCAENEIELCLNHNQIMSAEEHEKSNSGMQNFKNRETIHFKADENDLDLSLNPDKMTSTEEVGKFCSKFAIPRNRETINFQSAGQNDAYNMELIIKSENIMPIEEYQKYNLKQTYTKNNPNTNFETTEIDDESNMELSFNTPQTITADAQERLLLRNPNTKIDQSINFQIGDVENEKELCLNYNQMMSVVQQSKSDIQNLKNRKTIHFKTDENDLDLSLNSDKITSSKEVEKLCSKFEIPRNRETINFQTAEQNDAYNMELTIKSENIIPIEEYQKYTLKQTYTENNPITNLVTSEIDDESNMELSFNTPQTMITDAQERLFLRNPNTKIHQTINFQIGGAENEKELCLNHDQMMSVVQQSKSDIQNLKNRKTIHFKTDENDLDLSLNPDKMTSTKEVEKLCSKFEIPRNRETINFESAGHNEANNMELTIKSENIIPIEEYQKYTLKQTYTENNPITNLVTSEIDDESNMELSFNTPQTMITDAQERLFLRNPNTKIHQTINFQIGGAENEKELCLNHDQMMSVVQQGKSDIQNLKNRKTIHFKTDENDLDLSLNPDKMTSTKEVEKLCSKFAIPRNRETINFQIAGHNEANNLELTIKSENIIPIEEYQKYTLKQTYRENNPITNLLASEIDDKSNMELSFNTPQTMITDAQERLLLRNPNTKIHQTINFQIGCAENEKELCLNHDQMMSVVQQSNSDIQNLKNRKTIHFKTDENDLDLSLNPDKMTSTEKVEKLCSKFAVPRNRETINFQSAGHNEANNMELTIKSENVIPIEEYQKYTLKQTYTKNYPVTNFEISQIEDESNMELSFNTANIMLADPEQRLLSKDPNTKIHQTTGFLIGGCSDNDDMQLSLNNVVSSVRIDKLCSQFPTSMNRQNIHFETAAYNNEQDIELTINPDTTMLVGEHETLTSKQLNASHHHLRNSGYTHEDNTELTFTRDNEVLAAEKQRLFPKSYENVDWSEISEKYGNVDWSGFDKCITFPNVNDVWKAAKKRQKFKKSMSFNKNDDVLPFPSTQKISFLVDNFGAEYMENCEQGLYYKPVFPLHVSFESLIRNKYKNTNRPWRMNRNISGNNVLIFSYDSNKTFNLVFKLCSHKDYTDIVRFEKVLIRENQIHKKFSTIQRVQFNEIMKKLPHDLTNMYPTSSEFIKCLEDIDRICTLADESINHLLTSIAVTKSSMEFDKRNILVKKICRIKEPGHLTKIHEFHVKLGYIDQLSYRNIIFPSRSLLDISIVKLPVGIDFLHVFLKDPMKYILKQ